MRNIRLWLKDHLLKIFPDTSAIRKNALHQRSSHSRDNQSISLSMSDISQSVTASGFYVRTQAILFNMCSRSG